MENQELAYIRKMLLGIAILLICLFVALFAAIASSLLLLLITGIVWLSAALYVISTYFEAEHNCSKNFKADE